MNQQPNTNRRIDPWALCMSLLLFCITCYITYNLTIHVVGAGEGFAKTTGMFVGAAVSWSSYEILLKMRRKANSHE